MNINKLVFILFFLLVSCQIVYSAQINVYPEFDFGLAGDKIYIQGISGFTGNINANSIKVGNHVLQHPAITVGGGAFDTIQCVIQTNIDEVGFHNIEIPYSTGGSEIISGAYGTGTEYLNGNVMISIYPDFGG
ncbi:MAG TPA: hypothetical protein PKY81_15145, partial [bacterium]|nr:hypothetical protein [bacterium]